MYVPGRIKIELALPHQLTSGPMGRENNVNQWPNIIYFIQHL